MTLPRTLAAVAVLGSSLFAASASRAADNYKIDPEHSTVIYRISHFNIGNAYGRFDRPTGTVVLDTSDPTKTAFQFAVATANIDTANAKRDSDLKGPDYFNVKQFPTISFKSTSVKPGSAPAGQRPGEGAGSAPASPQAVYDVTGDLTLHGVTKTITFPITKTGEGDTKVMGYRTGWEAHVDLKRSDYGMTGGKGAVGDDVHLIISFEAVKQ